MSDVQEIEAYLAHYGVKGMRWGVRRRGDDSSGGTARKTKPAKKSGPAPRRSKAEMEVLAANRAQRIKVGKEVTKAVLIAVGTVAVASLAGPVVAAGASAIAKATFTGDVWSVSSTSTDSRIINGESRFVTTETTRK